MYRTLLLLLSISFSQTVSDYAYTHAEVSALAGAVVSENGNSWSIFHNPAGIVEVEDIQLSLGGAKLYGYNWLVSNNISSIFPIKNIGNVSLGFQQLETKYNNSSLSNEQILSIGHAKYIQNDKNSSLSIGYTANIIQWSLGKSAGLSGDGTDGLELGNLNSITIDFGAIGSLRNKYRFGVFLKNINSGAFGKGITRQILPRRINVGITYMPIKDLATSIVSEHLLGRDDMQIKFALRYSLNSNIIIYTGAQSNPSRFGIGGTFNRNKKSISYGLLTHPVMPITHKINIGLSL